MMTVYAMIQAIHQIHALFGIQDFARSYVCQNPDS
jgi:hypothetical protein